MPPNLATASIKALGATASRTLAAHFGEVVNVKDFGALGDHVTDDTAAIQAALDYAFGPYNNPHGGVLPDGPRSNKPVYFPPGYYIVTSPVASKAILGMGGDGSGVYPSSYDRIKVTVASTSGLASGDMVLIKGAGGSNYSNYSFAITVLDGTHFTLRNSQWTQAPFSSPSTYTSGGTATVPALKLRASGALIYGGGRQATVLRCMTDNAACISTNGFSFSMVRDMTFASGLGGISFDYNSDGDIDGFNIGGTSNTFMNLGAGGPSNTTDYGFAFGMGMFMCDSSTLFNCYVGGCDVAAIYIHNQNSLVHSVYGGNITSSMRGIWVHGGSISVIQGVAFQNYQVVGQVADIFLEGGADDSYAIIGCRTESKNFLLTGAAQSFVLNGCSQGNLGTGGEGFFISGHGNFTLNNCISLDGYIEGDGAYVVLNNCQFSYTDYLTAGTENYAYLEIHPRPIKVITDATLFMPSSVGGHKLQFNRATPQVVTVPRNSDNSNRLAAGTVIEVQQVGVGQTTFVGDTGVTINSSNGLKLRAQYSCATLTCDGVDTWTLSGDTHL